MSVEVSLSDGSVMHHTSETTHTRIPMSHIILGIIFNNSIRCLSAKDEVTDITYSVCPTYNFSKLLLFILNETRLREFTCTGMSNVETFNSGFDRLGYPFYCENIRLDIMLKSKGTVILRTSRESYLTGEGRTDSWIPRTAPFVSRAFADINYGVASLCTAVPSFSGSIAFMVIKKRSGDRAPVSDSDIPLVEFFRDALYSDSTKLNEYDVFLSNGYGNAIYRGVTDVAPSRVSGYGLYVKENTLTVVAEDGKHQSLSLIECPQLVGEYDRFNPQFLETMHSSIVRAVMKNHMTGGG